MPKEKKKKQQYNILWIILLVVIIWGFFITPSENKNMRYEKETQYNNQESSNINQVSINNNINNQQVISSNKNDTLKNYELGKFSRDYQWEYNNKIYGFTFNLYPKVYEIFKNRERTRDFDLFASDYYGKDFIESITNGLKEYAQENDLTNDEIPYFIISFVQDLPYTSDSVTTGFDEYPRFPYETIYDNGGDCEDTAILTSAMLNELGYGVALLEFPGHMAVGIKCTPSSEQSYYTYQETDFCYLETTGENWEIGKIPSSIESKEAIVKPLIEKPALNIDFASNYEYDRTETYVNVNTTIRNLGSKNAENVIIYIALQTSNEEKIWDSIESKELLIKPEEGYEYSVTNLHSPTGSPFRIYIRAFGDNVISDETVSSWIYWE